MLAGQNHQQSQQRSNGNGRDGKPITVGLHYDMGTRMALEAGWTEDNMEQNSREGERKSWMEELERVIPLKWLTKLVDDRVLRPYVPLGAKKLGEGEGAW